ncbi:hypothetical protein T265_06932 [Opisthorchis viverrini]|uniref:Uncharacterized protein n=1 Tax=Opisthorchis viverrini TaxID=6198 RepID=A0A074ZQN2_OPIVI|nr:hypothetical protein T265_06932 [Opisthorchis viverrini]KER25640.1 hypothetical protein T265_06932 [Opisthorchis viverrini]
MGWPPLCLRHSELGMENSTLFVRAVLLYGCETRPIRAVEMRSAQVFDNRCLRTIARVNWCRQIRNEAVRKRVFGRVTGTSIEECVRCVGWDMCCVRRTIVCRREYCFPCPIRSGVNREVANP